jgi:hypothetical protein
MGVNSKALIYFFEMIEVLDRNIPGTKICCLGNLMLRKYANILIKKYCGTKEYFIYFSDFLKARGFEVENIDINGKNAIQFDLRGPIDVGLTNKFDVCLNAGTTEHIKTCQYEVFKNIHDLCKKNGAMIHILPTVEWGHSYWFYPFEFFNNLCKNNQYKIMDYRKTPIKFGESTGKESLFITLIKKIDRKFIEKEKWLDPDIDKIGSKRFLEVDYEGWITNLKADKEKI